jgi:hypothetical protein
MNRGADKRLSGACTSMSGYATSMIGLCQEGKSSPDALRRSAGVILIDLRRVFVASQPWFLFEIEPDFHLLTQPLQLLRRLTLCFPASLETYRWEHRKLALLRPVALTARPGGPRTEEILLIRCHVLRSDAATGLCSLKIPLPTIDGHEVGHQLSCHCQRRAIGIALLLFLVVEHG